MVPIHNCMGQTTESAKKLWLDEDYRAKVVSATAAGKATPESRAKRSASSRALWDDPEYREKMAQKGPPPNKCSDDQKIEKVCSGCSREFKVLPSRQHTKFCSRECRKLVKQPHRKLSDRICEACQNLFTPVSATQPCCKTCVPTHKAGVRWARFKFSQPMYDRMLEEQQHCCAICTRTFAELPSQQIHLDHCHATNRVRGILCQACNTFVGMFEAREGVLDRVIEYVKFQR